MFSQKRGSLGESKSRSMERGWSTFTDYKAPDNVKDILCATSSFRHEVDENCALLGYYAASSGNFLPTFRDNLSRPSSRVKNRRIRRRRGENLDSCPLKIGPIICRETSVRNYHGLLRNTAEELSSQGER